MTDNDAPALDCERQKGVLAAQIKTGGTFVEAVRRIMGAEHA